MIDGLDHIYHEGIWWRRWPATTHFGSYRCINYNSFRPVPEYVNRADFRRFDEPAISPQAPGVQPSFRPPLPPLNLQ